MVLLTLSYVLVVIFVSQNGSVASVIVGATQVFFTAVAALVMDRAGRKVLLILSGQYLPFILPLIRMLILLHFHVYFTNLYSFSHLYVAVQVLPCV